MLKDDNVNFAPSFFLLQKEAMLAESSLMSGLTAIRKGTLTERGKLYTGFFQLSIGFERLLKLILVIDYMVSNSLKPPTNDWLRGYGHDLERLYEASSALVVASNIMMPLDNDLPITSILRCLSVFAKSSRYHNLDTLTNPTSQIDPLSEWGKILEDILQKEVSQQTHKRITMGSSWLARKMEEHCSVVYHDLDNQPLNLEGLLSKPALQEAAAPFIILHLYSIIAPIRKVLIKLGNKGCEATHAMGYSRMHIPDMSDMLVFTTADRASIMRKMRWT